MLLRKRFLAASIFGGIDVVAGWYPDHAFSSEDVRHSDQGRARSDRPTSQPQMIGGGDPARQRDHVEGRTTHLRSGEHAAFWQAALRDLERVAESEASSEHRGPSRYAALRRC
jgi:hypothetical protein